MHREAQHKRYERRATLKPTRVQTQVVESVCPEVQEEQDKVDRHMQQIMRMVAENSQMTLVNGLLMNSVNNQPVFVQVVFNSDNEALTLLIIVDFTKFDIIQVDLDKVDHPLWHMMFFRFGSTNSAIIMKINTVMMSYEFHLFVQLIIDGIIAPTVVEDKEERLEESPEANKRGSGKSTPEKSQGRSGSRDAAKQGSGLNSPR